MIPSLHAATPSRTVCHGFSAVVLLRTSLRQRLDALDLAAVNPPRLERSDVAGGEAGGARKFSGHDNSVFSFAHFVIANSCEQFPHGFARSR